MAQAKLIIKLLTDVNDNSIQGEKDFIAVASRESNINLTIVGISNQFKSQVCEALKDIRGFNYFCAVNDSDIKKYVFEQFDFNFFPSVYDMEITISSKDISSFEVFGVPDSGSVPKYNEDFLTPRENYVVSKVKTSFPSAVEIHGDQVCTFGGLILLKLKRHSKESHFKASLRVTYENPDGSKAAEDYDINFEFHEEEQFFSQESLRQAIEGFIFVSELKQLLKEKQQVGKNQNLYEKHWSTLEQL